MIEHLTTSRAFASWWVARMAIEDDEYDDEGRLLRPKIRLGCTITKNDRTRCWEDYQIEYHAAQTRGLRLLGKESILASLDRALELYTQERINALSDTLACQVENLDPLRAFVTAVTGGGAELEKHTHVLAHWIWTVKRLMSHRAVGDPLVLIFFGPQGAGKTTAVDLLTSPFRADDLTWPNAHIDVVCDERNWFRLNRAYIVTLNELVGANRKLMNAFKTIVADRDLRPRILGQNAAERIDNKASFIGTTNQPIAYQLEDPTGNRRFYEIKCLPAMDLTALRDGITAETIWAGVDERLDQGYLGDYRDQVLDDQRSTATADPYEDFLSHYSIAPDPAGDEYDADALYATYVAYTTAGGERAETRRQFRNTLERVWGFKRVDKRTAHRRWVVYGVREGCGLPHAVPAAQQFALKK